MSTSEGKRGDVQHGGSPAETPLYDVARALAEALTADQVATAVFDHALLQLGATTAGLWLREPDDVIRFSGGAGEGAMSDVGDIPLDSNLPAAEVVRTGQVVTFGSRAERDERWPELKDLGGVRPGENGDGAVVVLPLAARGRRMGCMHIGWTGAAPPLGPDIPLLQALTDLCAGALDRAQLFDAERRARETLEFLSQGTRLMVSALDPDVIVQSLVRLAVPRLAPWCAVYVEEEEHLVRTAVEVADDPELARLIRRAAPIPVDSDLPLAQVYRTGRAVVMPAVQADLLRATYPAELADRVDALPGETWTALVTPIEATGQVIGVMSLLSPRWGGDPPSEVRYAAEGLAARAGVSLRNARRYLAQVDNVALLTGALLPERVPEVPGMAFAARYVPASGGVCGDWYEMEEMPDGRVLVGIGDASGHGVPAAATMAHLRNAARGLAVAGHSPGEMLGHLSTMIMRGNPDTIATTIYGLVDPRTGEGTWASAGHPTPIVIRPDGTVEVLEELTPGPPLGSGVTDYSEINLTLPAGARLVVYTDGMFERRGEDPSTGLARLIEIVTGATTAAPSRARKSARPPSVEESVAGALARSRRQLDDDACVLVIGRTTG
ncbi:MAG TPA: SpoIIE family protein phosphatase [Acidimicrobiales bacterium]|nr:SpoIIE family protein phosphatase [Acidimicrobiales bacterium]